MEMKQGPFKTIHNPISHPEHTMNTKEKKRKGRKLRKRRRKRKKIGVKD
jgi:hypothetical protein